MIYFVETSLKAKSDLEILKKSDKKAYKKALSLFLELNEHPRTGTGKPELLKNDKRGLWARRINRKHRLVYKIEDDKVIVFVISALGHYNDK
ncbi:MAG: Txe/YoeB family addiction module toxin [Tannerella sp.]|jgi:toxin YoeB|nr:Txe/YoeB family addiction module toxin [Tannerella sp.]